jgi:hypothetical protein
MVNTTGLSGAAPIWSAFMQYAVPLVSGNNPTPFIPPSGIVDRIICSSSGTEPSQWCKGGQRNEYFASDQLPLPKSKDLLYETEIDTWTGLIAGDACKEFAKKDLVMNVTDEWGRKWLRAAQGKDWLRSNDLPENPFFAPDRECSSDDPRPLLEFSVPKDNDTLAETSINVRGIIDTTKGNFTGWRLEYGTGNDPSEWIVLATGTNVFENPETIFDWDLTKVNGDRLTLRLYLMNGEEFYAEKRIFLTLNLPTPTPQPTLTPSLTPTPTATTIILVPTDTPTETPTPTLTPPPTETPTETVTPVTP